MSLPNELRATITDQTGVTILEWCALPAAVRYARDLPVAERETAVLQLEEPRSFDEFPARRSFSGPSLEALIALLPEEV